MTTSQTLVDSIRHILAQSDACQWADWQMERPGGRLVRPLPATHKLQKYLDPKTKDFLLECSAVQERTWGQNSRWAMKATTELNLWPPGGVFFFGCFVDTEL
jgi:hypothetical protein